MEALSGPTTWPDLGWLLFVPVLFGQCALLHPAFDSRLSSSLRLAILVPILALTLRAPWTYAFAPRERCRGLNAVLAMLSAFGGWKALEWGLVQDRTIYEWVGFDGESAMTPGGGRGEGCVDEGSRTPEKSKKGGEGARRRGGVPRETAGTDDGRIPVEREARDASWLSIAFSTAHLFASLRGTGYAFSVVPPRRRPRLSRREFILDTLKILAWSHSLLVLCSIIISTPYTRRLAFASHFAPNLPPLAIHITIESTSYVSFGLAAWVGLVTASSLLNLLSIAIHSALLLPLPPSLHLKPFDSRQYAPLFDMPFAPRSVAEYWSRQWHRLFWRSFRFLTYDPVERATTLVTGNAVVGKAVGALSVFTFSAAAHEYAIWCATSGIAPPLPRTTFLEKYSSTLFFFLMGLLALGESVFTRVTGRGIGGVWGFLWTSSLQSTSGILLYWSWANLGFAESLPGVEEWSWQRWVVPISCLAPRPLWTKSSVG